MTAYPRRSPPPRCLERSATDRAFDTLVPTDLQHLSETHWTPTHVAIRVVKALSPRRGDRILDVGSGIGKLCSIAALCSPAEWVGIEEYEPLVTSARRLARELRVEDRTTFLVGDAFSLDWDQFDIIYFYNPFELPLFPDRIDAATHELEYRRRVARTEDRLAALSAGTRVVTLAGFGGAIPSSFDLVRRERVGAPEIELESWVQRAFARSRPGWS